MSIEEAIAKVHANYSLESVLADLQRLPDGLTLSHQHVTALSHYVRRIGQRPDSPSLAALVDIINARFTLPMFAPGAAAWYEPKSIVFGLERFPQPSEVKNIITPLLMNPSLNTLTQLVEDRGEALVIDVVAALIGRLANDLYIEAGGRELRATRLARIWAVVDRVVQGVAYPPDPVGDIQPELRRPVELRDGWQNGVDQDRPPLRGLSGWNRLRAYLQHGLPYEFMVMQRMVGTPFGSAQNAASSVVADYLSDLFLLRYAGQVGLPFLRTIDGPNRDYPPYVSKEQMERITGVRPSPDIAFVRPSGDKQVTWQAQTFAGYLASADQYTITDVVAVVESKVASDGGTARQKCDELRRQFAQVAVQPGMLAAALVDGSGWNQRRAEVSRLALDISGQIYRLSQSPELVRAIRDRL